MFKIRLIEIKFNLSYTMESIQNKINDNPTIFRHGVENLEERLKDTIFMIEKRFRDEKFTSEEEEYVKQYLLKECMQSKREEVL